MALYRVASIIAVQKSLSFRKSLGGIQHVILSCLTGQPVVWAISDKEDTATLEAVCNVIHTRCPTATVSTLMQMMVINILGIILHVTFVVDLAGAIACSQVYPDIQHVLCRWHVDR